MLHTLHNDIRERIKKEFSEDEVERSMEAVLACIDKRKCLTIHDLDSSTESIEDSIFRASVKGI